MIDPPAITPIPHAEPLPQDLLDAISRCLEEQEEIIARNLLFTGRVAMIVGEVPPHFRWADPAPSWSLDV